MYLSVNNGYSRLINGSYGDAYLFIGTNGTSVATFNGNGGWNDVNANSPTINNYQAWCIVAVTVGSSVLTPYVNGTAQNTHTGTTAAFSNFTIGSFTNAPTSQSYSGDIGDLIVYNSVLTTTQRQQVEGYLAWKWGLQTYLPGAHPYYSTSPNGGSTSTLTSTITLNLAGYVQSGANYILKPQVPLAIAPYYTGFNPASLSALALWIDGADPLGTGVAPAQGTLISSLKDKSGNNRAISTFSTTVGFPIYKTAANGALGAIQLAAGNGIFLSSISLTPYMSLYAVYSPINPSTGVTIEQGLNALSTVGFLLTSVSSFSTMYTIGVSQAFTPLSIASLSLWLDASQSSSFTFASSSNISSWADRSGKANNATQPTAGIQPTYAGSTVYLNGSQWFAVNLDFVAGHDFSAFIVLNNTNYVNIYGALGGGSFSGSSYLHNGFSSSGGYRVNYYGNDYYPSITANYHAGTTNLINIDWVNTGGVGKTARANGSIEGGPNGQTGAISAMANGGTIANVVGQGILSGTIYEIIFILDTDINTITRNKLEGYLMWKWGIQSYLPVGHPYKSAAP